MFNPFTFLREHKVLEVIKKKAIELLKEHKDELVAIAEKYINEKAPAAKTALIEFIMTNIKLGFPYSMFKGTIRKVLTKNLDNLVELVLAKLQEI